MAELHLPNIDDELLDRLRERARQHGVSLEEQVRILLERSSNRETDKQEEISQTLRIPSPDRSFREIDPVDTPGEAASELLIRDRRQ